jgi:hypothetical protein
MAFPSVSINWLTTVLAALALCSLFLVVSYIVAWSHLRQFPGPALAHCSYLWIGRAMFSGRMPSIMTAAQAKYGPIIRIGPNDLLVCSADEFRRMNTLRSKYTRGGWYQTMKLDPDGHSIFSEPDTAKHDKRKAILAGGFAGRGDMNLEADVDSQIAVFVDLLSKKVHQHQRGHQAV